MKAARLNRDRPRPPESFSARFHLKRSRRVTTTTGTLRLCNYRAVVDLPILCNQFSAMNTDVISGGCLCGWVRYEVSGQPYNITHCHCLDCRRNSGAPLVTWASFTRSDFRFTTGQPRELPWAGRLP